MKRLTISNGKFVNYIAHDNAESVPINDDIFHTKTDKKWEEPWEAIILSNGGVRFSLGAQTDMFNFSCDIEPDGSYTLYVNYHAPKGTWLATPL